MPTSFVSHAVLLKNVFDRRFLYSIPIYQRPFSWSDKHATVLFDDIVEAMGDEEGSPAIETFFLGAIILTGHMAEVAKKPLGGKLIAAFNAVITGVPPLPNNIQGTFDVVDGKQRLVTFKILLCLLRDLSTNGDHSDFKNLIGDGENGNSYRLELCGGEKDFLQKYVLPKGASIKPAGDLKNLSDSERNLIIVRDSLHQNLLDLSDKYRMRLLDYLVNHCEIVIILSEKIDHAFQIFLSMNSKGLDLEKGDVLKAKLMAKLTDQQVAKYLPIWNQWNDSLGEERGRFGNQKMTFFNHFRFALTSSPTNLLSDFDNVVEKAGGEEPFIEQYLIPNANAYEILTKTGWPADQPYKSEMDLVIGTLNWLPHHDWITPAMQAIIKYKNDPERLLAFFRKLDQLAYGLLILPGGAPDRKKKYNPLKRALRDDDGKLDSFEKVEFSTIEKGAIFKAIERGLHKNRQSAARLLLFRIDMAVSGKPPSYYNALIEKEAFSVEHLLPHSPAQNSQWMIDFADETQRLYNTELFGNLFLVRQHSENPLMKNYDFAQKQQILFGKGEEHPIHLTNELKQQATWNLNDIANRQIRLLAILKQIWP